MWRIRFAELNGLSSFINTGGSFVDRFRNRFGFEIEIKLAYEGM